MIASNRPCASASAEQRRSGVALHFPVGEVAVAGEKSPHVTGVDARSLTDDVLAWGVREMILEVIRDLPVGPDGQGARGQVGAVELAHDGVVHIEVQTEILYKRGEKILTAGRRQARGDVAQEIRIGRAGFGACG